MLKYKNFRDPGASGFYIPNISWWFKKSQPGAGQGPCLQTDVALQEKDREFVLN